MKATTKGGIILEDIRPGDIHYEYEYGMCIQSEVITKPTCKDGYWEWQSKHVNSDRIIDYAVSEGMSHYGPNLYNYEAYSGCKMI